MTVMTHPAISLAWLAAGFVGRGLFPVTIIAGIDEVTRPLIGQIVQPEIHCVCARRRGQLIHERFIGEGILGAAQTPKRRSP